MTIPSWLTGAVTAIILSAAARALPDPAPSGSRLYLVLPVRAKPAGEFRQNPEGVRNRPAREGQRAAGYAGAAANSCCKVCANK
jgi:hypothetical protein